MGLSVIKVEDYTDLAHWYSNRSNKKSLQGIELDDLYQSAMIGIWIASNSYDSTQGEFTTYAHKFIEGEINNLIYKISTVDGTKQRVPRIKEELVSDILDSEAMEDHYEETFLEAKYFLEYITGLPLSAKDKAYFVNMVKYGDTEATKLYMSVHDCTRQRANQVKKDIRKVAMRYNERLNRC